VSAPYYPPGKYACKITDQALGESSTGNPQFALRFTVLGPVDPENPESYLRVQGMQQYERTYYKSITEKTIEYFLADLKTLGFKGSTFKELDKSMPTYHSFIGMDVDMFCGHEKDQQGEMREKWVVARTAGPLEVKPLESKKLRDLDNLFGKHLKGLSSAAPKPQPQQPAAAMATTVDEELGF